MSLCPFKPQSRLPTSPIKAAQEDHFDHVNTIDSCMVVISIQISRRTSEDNELYRSLRRPQETALLMSHIQSEVSAADHVPSSKEFLIHILFYLLSHVLLVGSVLHSVAYHVLGLELDI